MNVFFWYIRKIFCGFLSFGFPCKFWCIMFLLWCDVVYDYTFDDILNANDKLLKNIRLLKVLKFIITYSPPPSIIQHFQRLWRQCSIDNITRASMVHLNSTGKWHLGPWNATMKFVSELWCLILTKENYVFWHCCDNINIDPMQVTTANATRTIRSLTHT